MTTKIINGDAWNEVKRMSLRSVDFVFYDPPYNVGKDYDGYDDNYGTLTYKMLMRTLIIYCNAIALNGIAIYLPSNLAQEFWMQIPEANQIIVHKRAKGIIRHGYSIQYHCILSTAKPLIKTSDLWDDIRLPGEGYLFKEPHLHSINPGFTSLELTKRVIETFTKEGDTVLDPFAGIGTTGVACKMLGRNFIGIEQSHKYCDYAQERIDKA